MQATTLGLITVFDLLVLGNHLSQLARNELCDSLLHVDASSDSAHPWSVAKSCTAI